MRLSFRMIVSSLRRLRLPALPSAIYLAARWVMRVVSLGIVLARHRREPSSLLAWVMTILFLPWLGLPLFLLFGSNRMPKQYQARHKRLQEDLDPILDSHRAMVHRPLLDSTPGLAVLTRLAATLGGLPVTQADSLKLMTDYLGIFEQMIHDIEQAERHVHVLFYIYADDEIGRRFTRALIRAAKRGVVVRVLVDAGGSAGGIGDLDQHLKRAGADFRVFLPVRPSPGRFVRFDLRNHRKLLVIDGQIAFTGSINVVDQSYHRRHGLLWQDVMVRVTGPVVNHLQTVFIQDWYAETGELLDLPPLLPEHGDTGRIALQVLPSGPNYATMNYQLAAIDALHSARRDVRITTPYLVPSDSLLQALHSAILRGVSVTLIVPKHSDHRFVDIASHAYFRDLLNMGVNIRLFLGGLLHAKTLTIDDHLAFVSTGNFDIRSFELNYELTLLIFHPPSVEQIIRFQKDALRRCESLTGDDWSRRPLYKKIVQNAAKMLSPFL